MVHFCIYHILLDSVSIRLIQIDGFLDISCNLDFILVFNGVFLSIFIKGILHFNLLLIILSEFNYPLPLWHIDDIIFSCIGIKGKFSIFLDGIHSLPFLLYSFPQHIHFSIIIWQFTVVSYVVKCPLLGSIIISRVEDIDEAS